MKFTKMIITIIITAVLAAGCVPLAPTAKPTMQATEAPTPDTTQAPVHYSYADIARSLYDMTVLSGKDGFKAMQWSSYDRKSQYIQRDDTYEEWDANADGAGYFFLKNGEYVIARMKGAGFINRIWIGNAEWQGDAGLAIISIYIDGQEKPVLSAPVRKLLSKEYFDCGLCYACVPRGGHNLYLPITYNDGCYVTLDRMDSLYYHIGYSQLPDGCTTDSFVYPMTENMKDEIAKADAELAIKPEAIGTPVSINPDETREIFADSKSGAVTTLAFKANTDDPYAEIEALQALVLQAYWDGAEKPAVFASLAQFYGQFQPTGDFNTYPISRENGWLYCKFRMPYDSAKLTLTNQGTEPLNIEVSVKSESGETDGDMRFCASWRRMTGESYTGAGCDSDFLNLKGCGKYAGMILHVYQKDSGTWWGEGDEKLFVDGEKFPSFFGTGSEDYFGFSWADPTLFSKPYHAQLVCQNYYAGGDGNKVNARFHISDSVCFTSSFDGSMENYYADNYFAAISYYYLNKDDVAENAPQPTTLLQRTEGYWSAAAVKQRYEGEGMESSGKTPGIPQGGNDVWSGSLQMLWTNRDKNGELTVYFRTEKGRYDITAGLTGAGDFGIFDIYIDENKQTTVDLYQQSINVQKYDIASIELSDGLHRMKFKCVGKNEMSVDYLMGLDYITVEKVK